MKKIVIISSSIRNKSNSELLAQQALQGALAERKSCGADHVKG